MRHPLRVLAASALWLACAAASSAASAAPFVYLTNWYAQAEHGGFYQAQAQGLYKQAGLEVAIRMGGPQINIMQQMLAGKADCIMGYDVETMKVWEQDSAATVTASMPCSHTFMVSTS